MYAFRYFDMSYRLRINVYSLSHYQTPINTSATSRRGTEGEDALASIGSSPNVILGSLEILSEFKVQHYRVKSEGGQFARINSKNISK